MKHAVAVVGISVVLAIAVGAYVAGSEGGEMASTSPPIKLPPATRTNAPQPRLARVWADPPIRTARTPAAGTAPVETYSVALASVDTAAHETEPKASMRPVTSRKIIPRSALRTAKGARPVRYVSLQTSRQQGRYKSQPSAPMAPISSEPASASVEVEPIEFSLASR